MEKIEENRNFLIDMFKGLPPPSYARSTIWGQMR